MLKTEGELGRRSFEHVNQESDAKRTTHHSTQEIPIEAILTELILTKPKRHHAWKGIGTADGGEQKRKSKEDRHQIQGSKGCSLVSPNRPCSADAIAMTDLNSSWPSRALQWSE